MIHKIQKAAMVLSLCVIFVSFQACSGTSYLESKEGTLLSEDLATDDESESSNQSSGASENSLLYVQVAGAVESPGVFQVKEGTRIFQVIDQAGGLTDEADASSLNQALCVSDGDFIYVYTRAEVEEIGVSAETDSSGKVNLNTASKETLMTIPGIGESKAALIIEYRESNGGFSSVEDIMNVQGIKEGTYNKIKDSITV